MAIGSAPLLHEVVMVFKVPVVGATAAAIGV